MKTIILIIFIFASEAVLACSCNMGMIADSYKHSSAIFYGKHLGSRLSSDFYDMNGRPFKIDNFEVIRFYKGVDTAVNDKIKNLGKSEKFIVSLESNCNDACGMCFDSSKYYLIYCYNGFINGHFITDGCSGSREIINENFVNESRNKDRGKNEHDLLKQLAEKDSAPDLMAIGINLKGSLNFFRDENIILKDTLSTYKIYIYALLSSIGFYCLS